VSIIDLTVVPDLKRSIKRGASNEEAKTVRNS
jgi:hypothetical protein